jgi:malonyl-CoA O-methyltransferase
MKIVKEFSRFAHEYKKYNVIQKEVAQYLSTLIREKNYQHILDIGSGDGAVYKCLLEQKITYDTFTALDFSKEMLAIHPDSKNINKVYVDFNQTLSVSDLGREKFDLIVSASALQWSTDLNSTLKNTSKFSGEFCLALFTSGTFRTLHETAKINSPIYSLEEILEALERYFKFDYEVVNYVLNFESVHDMLHYIKKSGVSSGEKKLSYKGVKALMSDYPLRYLEFEVLFMRGIKKEGSH